MWPIPQETADLVILTEEFLNGKLYLLCSEMTLQGVTDNEVNVTLSFYVKK